jgi:glutamate-1-semialdehyde 2,1-aminomutase
MGVVKFEGHYHGVNDTLGFSHWPKLAKAGPADRPRAVADSAGIPPPSADLIPILPFNDVVALEDTLRARGEEIAAVIMEPINYDSCGLVPTAAFLQAVRGLTRELGIVLIFDEILSGFRCGPGSATQVWDGHESIVPDMTCLGKSVGGGMPLSVFMGRRDIMETCTPVGPALHSGTYNAHLTLILAAHAFLDVVTQEGFYHHLNALGDRLYRGIREIMERRGIPCWVQGAGARFGLLFGLEEEPRNYRDVAKQDLAMADRFHVACLERGLYLAQGSPHHGYSAAHTMEDIAFTLDAMDRAAASL